MQSDRREWARSHRIQQCPGGGPLAADRGPHEGCTVRASGARRQFHGFGRRSRGRAARSTVVRNWTSCFLSPCPHLNVHSPWDRRPGSAVRGRRSGFAHLRPYLDSFSGLLAVVRRSGSHSLLSLEFESYGPDMQSDCGEWARSPRTRQSPGRGPPAADVHRVMLQFRSIYANAAGPVTHDSPSIHLHRSESAKFRPRRTGTAIYRTGPSFYHVASANPVRDTSLVPVHRRCSSTPEPALMRLRQP
jgi:hypothetical protein